MNEPTENKMSVNKHGTVVFDFTGGFDEKDLFNVLTAANQKAVEYYRRNESHELRVKAHAAIERRKYESMPGVIRHPDGVLEIPMDS